MFYSIWLELQSNSAEIISYNIADDLYKIKQKSKTITLFNCLLKKSEGIN